VVRFIGSELPAPTRIENTTDPEVCGRGHTLEEIVISAEDRGVQHAIIAIGDMPETAIPRVEPETLVLDNRECRFSPHAAVMVAGSTLEAINSDPILHTTHLYGPAELNISLPVRGARSARRLERAGVYTVRCDVHGWMQAVVRVDLHPYHAVTDESGAFRIDGVPEGRYRLEAWHERLGTWERDVEVDAGTTTAVVIEYSMNP
jgi:plastocyanin